jgi:imidazolonepropionase-like amidohydrolase
MHRSLRLPVALLPLLACAEEPPLPAEAPAVAPPPVASAPAPAPAVTVHRSLVCFKLPCGTSIETTAPDGTISLAFDLHDNGRGPGANATLRLAPDGTIASFEAHGHQEMGTTLDETFTCSGGHASWKSTNEEGQAESRAPGFFLPMSAVQTDGLLAAALLRAPDHTLALYPSGQAHIDEVGDFVASAGGQSKHLRAFAITRVGLTQSIVWTDEETRFFGEVNPWVSEVPDEWVGAVDALVAKQREILRALDKKVAERFAHGSGAAGTALVHARVLDVERGVWAADQTVVFVKDTIRAVGPSKTTKVPAGAEVVDLGGKALVPGLWDMHAHLGPEAGALDIASGVTTVRDVGNDPDQLDDFKARYDDGSAVGPHVYRAGFIEGLGKDASHLGVKVGTVDDAKAAVEFYAKRGYEMIKIYNSVPVELVPVLAKEAHAHKMGVTGHIPVHMLANEAVRAGYDGIEHINMLFLNFFADHDTDTRTPKRFSLVADKAADFDLSSKPVKDFVALLRDHHTVVDPTYAAFEDLFVSRQGVITPDEQWVVDRLPVQSQRGWKSGGLPVEPSNDATYRRSWDKVVSMVKVLRDAHVTLVAGTDALPGLMYDHELELLQQGGLTTAEVLRDATIVSARVMNADKKSGSIAVGKVADFVVVDGDPLAKLADLRRTVTTYRGGVGFPASGLFETMGVKPGT